MLNRINLLESVLGVDLFSTQKLDETIADIGGIYACKRAFPEYDVNFLEEEGFEERIKKTADILKNSSQTRSHSST